MKEDFLARIETLNNIVNPDNNYSQEAKNQVKAKLDGIQDALTQVMKDIDALRYGVKNEKGVWIDSISTDRFKQKIQGYLDVLK